MEDINPKTGLPVQEIESDLNIKAKRGWPYYIAYSTVYVLIWLLIWPKFKGQENLPKKGGYIVAANHVNGIDGILVKIGMNGQPIEVIAKMELFQGKFKGWFFRNMGAIPVDRSKRNGRAVDLAVERLKEGAVVQIMPEGTINRGDELLPFKMGAVVMASRAKVPIVPVAITGRMRMFGSGKLKVAYGEPMKVGDDLEKANEELRETIGKMKKNLEKPKGMKQYDGLFQDFMKPILLGLIKFVYRPEVVGRENIPKKGGVIIVSNHKHDLDPFLIMSGRTGRRTHFLAKHECTDWKIGRGIGAFGVVFVDRQAEDKTKTKEQVMKFLGKGRVFALFPEGTRNKTEDLLMPFQFGAVSFAQKGNVPIVPAAIVGQYRPFKKGLKIVFSKPIEIPEGDLTKTNEKIRETIEKILIENGEEAHRPEIYKHYQAKAAKEAAKKGRKT